VVLSRRTPPVVGVLKGTPLQCLFLYRESRSSRSIWHRPIPWANFLALRRRGVRKPQKVIFSSDVAPTLWILRFCRFSRRGNSEQVLTTKADILCLYVCLLRASLTVRVEARDPFASTRDCGNELRGQIRARRDKCPNCANQATETMQLWDTPIPFSLHRLARSCGRVRYPKRKRNSMQRGVLSAWPLVVLVMAVPVNAIDPLAGAIANRHLSPCRPTPILVTVRTPITAHATAAPAGRSAWSRRGATPQLLRERTEPGQDRRMAHNVRQRKPACGKAAWRRAPQGTPRSLY
jgi:hypothetical protein